MKKYMRKHAIRGKYLQAAAAGSFAAGFSAGAGKDPVGEAGDG